MGADQIEVRSRGELRQWLTENHHRADSIWLVTWKKHTPHHVSWNDVVDEALCFGWIDSQPRKLDRDRSMIRLSPRKVGSGWSGVNKVRIDRLIASGAMAAPGLAKVEQAKRDGSWSALDGASALVMPDDLLAAFELYPGAWAQFERFPRSSRRAILEWIAAAKRADTRARRLDETARLAQTGQRANHWTRVKD